MKEKPATEEKKVHGSVNDILALERTIMANERTFLAYIRTAMTLLVPGVTGVQLADTMLMKVISFLFVPLGILVFIIGTFRFMKKKKSARLMVEKS